DLLIDEYYCDLKEEKRERSTEKNTKEGDFVFKSVDRNKADYAVRNRRKMLHHVDIYI
ncbi:hypothetical protein PFTANZ_06500, partial [Plasmodium falciparum Tanzania (2000708)]